MRSLLWLLAAMCFLSPVVKANEFVLTTELEAILLPDVSTAWQSVTMSNNYVSAIPVCTYVLPTFAGSAPNYTAPPAVVRIKNITANSFDVRIQGWEDSGAAPSKVHCIVMEEGAHTLPDGRKMEAHQVISDKTSGQNATDGQWSQALLEDVSASIVHNYTKPVVLGAVISYEDNLASVVSLTDCDNRRNNPFHIDQADGICVGKHIGQITGSRKSEKIGYIVAESGSGTVNGIDYELAFGQDIVNGNNNANTGSTYALSQDHTIAVLTQGGQDGGNGSWAVLYGADPLPLNEMVLVVDEEIVEADVSRTHTTEPVYYWAFAVAELTLQKKINNDDGGSATSNDFTLQASGIDVISGVTGDAAITKVPVHPSSYVLSENTVPGYTASDWDCAGATVTGGNAITLAAGDKALCTILNDDDPVSTLTLIKEVKNANGGEALNTDFTLIFSNGVGSDGSGKQGDADITSAVIPAGQYSLSEDLLAGYRLVAIKCDGQDSDGTDGLTINKGENVTCFFYNADLGVDLSIKKSASNETPNIGDTLTFSLNVANSGPDTATNLTITDILPSGFSYVSGSINGADSRNDLDPTGAGLLWVIDSLATGAVETLEFQATVLALF